MDLHDSVRLKRFTRAGSAIALTASVILACLLGAAGCSSSDEDPLSPLMQGGAEMMRRHGDQRRRDARAVTIGQVRVAIVEVPAGLSHDALWDLVDEGAVSQQVSRSLVNNGFRIGLGGPDQWEAVVDALRDLAGRSIHSGMVINAPDRPMVIELKVRQGETTAFAVHPDNTVSGRNLPPGDYVLSFLCSHDPLNPSSITVTGQPQVHGTRRTPRTVGAGQDMALVNQQRIIGVNLLTFQMAVPTEGFLVIGPSPAVSRAHSLGGLFLGATREGIPVERVVLLLPEIVETDAS